MTLNLNSQVVELAEKASLIDQQTNTPEVANIIGNLKPNWTSDEFVLLQSTRGE